MILSLIYIKEGNIMIGIYKITNRINNHSYIGLSTDIEARWKQHKDPYNWKREPNKVLYQAMQKYGLKNFKFEVLEECTEAELGMKEKYYIALYDTFNHGYNSTSGGEDNKYDGHPNHKLTKQDTIDIRTRYKNKQRKNEVYQLYKDRIGESGFHKIWNGTTWKGIMDEVYTTDNKTFHSKNTANKGSANGRARLTEADVRNIRLRRKAGENIKVVYKDYAHLITYGSFTNVWTYQNWKNIIV